MTDAQPAPGGAPASTESPRRGRVQGGRSRRWVWFSLAAAVLALLVGVTLIWFQPQKLLYDHRVAEPPPPHAPTAALPVELAAGSFVSREHETHGAARVLRLPDGQVIVRFEGFTTSNGPVLVVWLSRNPAHGPDGAFDDDYVNLGPLKGNVGDQNYPVPAGVDATRYTSVVIWCTRFRVSFGAADLMPSS